MQHAHSYQTIVSPYDNGDPAGDWFESEVASCTRPDDLTDLMESLLARSYAGRLADRDALARSRLMEDLVELAHKYADEKPEALESLYQERRA